MQFARIALPILLLSALCFHPSIAAPTMTQEKQQSLTPQAVMERLKSGNQRFIDGKMKNRDLLSQAKNVAPGQHPVAVILNCMDSRTPPEIIFDQGIGDVFVIRIAGNIQNDDILGSMEFGTQVVGAPLIAVIGHTRCGAIQGACNKVKLGFLTGLLEKIHPAVVQADRDIQDHTCSNYTYVDEIAKDNVLLVMKQIQSRSPAIRKLIEENKVGIVGGMYDVNTGKVTFFDDHSMMAKQ